MSTEENESDHAMANDDIEEEAEDIEAEAIDAQPMAEDEEHMDDKNLYNAKDVNDQVFDKLQLRPDVVEEVQNAWNAFIRKAVSREAAGDAIYGCFYDSSPQLQRLFRTPRAVMAMRFTNGINQIISNLSDPKSLKVVVETLGFQHLDLEVTIPNVVIFRNAIVDLFTVEMGSAFSKKAQVGFCTFFNYVGGAYIYIRTNFALRLKILSSSWATANKRQSDELDDENAEGTKTEEIDTKQVEESTEVKKKKTTKKGSMFERLKVKQKKINMSETKSKEGEDVNAFKNTQIPTTFNDMFMFNAAVMGFAGSLWMNEVLLSFDAVVQNVSNSYRLQEECDVVSLRLAKYKQNINLGEFKAVMLASLRSLLPEDWNSDHEDSWSWLWENVERMIKALMGRPAQQEKALAKLWGGLDEAAQGMLCKEIYAKFFALAPAGQDYFKQSTTRLYFIANRIVDMSLEIFADPKKMVEDISALGLRHVGYGIPTELFGPFVSACAAVVREMTDDDFTVEAFRWSLGLISRILTRVILEGSTIVMKAINMNSEKQLKKAVGCAPRGKRSLWMLNIQVGTQSISPLLWAIETGSLESAKAIINDLLTIRADRDRYYYGMDIMFERHPDILKRLCLDAPALLPPLLDGLVWRSRTTENGMRRVNYYVKHLLVDAEGDFSKTIEWITATADPKLVCHPVVAMVTDMVWYRVAFRTFLRGKSWLILTLIVFIVGFAALKHLDESETSETERIVIAVCRCFIYICSLSTWAYYHRKICSRASYQEQKRVLRIPVPAYLLKTDNAVSLMLTISLILMLSMEPILHCWDSAGDKLFLEVCPGIKDMQFVYSIFSSLAIFMYFFLVIDMSVFFTRISAFVLVCFHMISEICLFLFALAFLILLFACAINALDQSNSDFASIPTAALTLMRISFVMYDDESYVALHEDPALMIGVIVYVVVANIFLAKLLIAQVNCSYQSTYQDMVGYARLNRGKILIEAMALVTKGDWSKFIKGLHLDERVEFGEGDMGLCGGIQVLEPANANVTTIDMIRRFGGSTSPAAQWPEEDNAAGDEEDRFERIEKLIEKVMQHKTGRKKNGKNESSGFGSSHNDSILEGSEHNSEH